MSGQPSDYLSKLYERNEIAPSMLKHLDLPMCLLYFPTLQEGHESDIISAVRKLFLDVNRNAKTPSEIRRVLLDDYSLTSICLRKLLNNISSDGGSFKIDHVDIDSDAEWDTYTPSRKLCAANIRILFELVKRILQEPADSINAKSFSDSRYRNINDSVQLTNAEFFFHCGRNLRESTTFQKQT